MIFHSYLLQFRVLHVTQRVYAQWRGNRDEKERIAIVDGGSYQDNVLKSSADEKRFVYVLLGLGGYILCE